jgi:hypothetical protein
MATKKNTAKCATGGAIGTRTIFTETGKAKKAGIICGFSRADGNCGAHGNMKCIHKESK